MGSYSVPLGMHHLHELWTNRLSLLLGYGLTSVITFVAPFGIGIGRFGTNRVFRNSVQEFCCAIQE